MDFETLVFEKKGVVGIITLNRPAQMNTINGQLLTDLRDAIVKCEIDDSLSVLVLTGGPKCFCAGADVKYVNSFTSHHDFPVFARLTRDTFHKVETCKKPVIAAISGIALGGGLELALCCDMRVASESAKLGLTEAKLGTIPGAGGTQRLPRLIGPALAKQLIFSGNFISGAEAYRINLVNEAVPEEEYLNRAIGLAEEMSERAPLALQAAKNCINTAMQVNLEAGLDFETQCAVFLDGTEDKQEGFHSFVEKRKPQWKGR